MISLKADSARWDAALKEKFARLEKRLNGGMRNVVDDARKITREVVQESLVRPETKRPHAGIVDAITASTYVHPGLAAVVLGDAKILDQLAIYWHALEVGSDHIVGRTVFGFSGHDGTFAPDSSRFRQETDTVSASKAKAAGVTPKQFAVVRNPITPHHILGQLSGFVQKRYTQEVAARFKEAFMGIPYKRQ